MVLVAGLAIGGATFAVSAATRNVEGRSAKAPSNSFFGPRTVVRAQQVWADAATTEQTYTGIVRARYESDLAFRVGAKIVSRHVEVGQRVAAGALLLRLDSTDFRLAVKVAEADLITAEADVLQTTAEDNRSVRLGGTGALSFSDVDKARSARDMAIGRRDRARESLTLARNRLSYCDLYADAAGVITTLFVEAGQVVSEGQTVARLARDGEKEAVVSLPENQALAAESGRASVTLWSAPGESFNTVLRELSPIADPATRTYQARFTIQNPGVKVALGMTATVHLTPADASPGYVLPLTSLLRNGDQAAVWLVDRTTGKLTLAPVTVREYRQETIVLADGVKTGQWVVTAGVQKLDAGMTVRVWEGN